MGEETVSIYEMNIYEKLSKIAQMSGVKEKNKSGFNFKYTTEDEILASVTSGMKKYHVSLIPSIDRGTLKIEPYTYTKQKKNETITVNEHVISNYTYTLAQNYPNPFNPSTVINYTIQETGLVQLRVYDILGSEISELVNEVKGLGNHSVVFNAANLAGGVYIYSINISGYKSSKKMVLIK